MPIGPHSVTLQLDKPRVVRFNAGTLHRIEEMTGKTIFEIVQTFGSYAPARALDGREPTNEEAQAVARRFSFTLTGNFIAACLGVSLDELDPIVPLNRFFSVLNELVLPFGNAVIELHGEEIQKKVLGSSEASAPGPVSN